MMLLKIMSNVHDVAGKLINLKSAPQKVVFNRYNYLSLKVTKRPFGHLDVSGGNSEKAEKTCNVHF